MKKSCIVLYLCLIECLIIVLWGGSSRAPRRASSGPVRRHDPVKHDPLSGRIIE